MLFSKWASKRDSFSFVVTCQNLSLEQRYEGSILEHQTRRELNHQKPVKQQSTAAVQVGHRCATTVSGNLQMSPLKGRQLFDAEDMLQPPHTKHSGADGSMFWRVAVACGLGAHRDIASRIRR